MARTLLLMRHGKSDWGAGAGDDAARPLARRGRRAARRVGRFLTEAGWAPGAAISSTAVRARDTVALAAEAGGWRCPVGLSEALYGTGPAEVLAEIRRRGSDAEVLLAAGHEPTWSTLASRLIGGGRLRFPTAALAAIRFDVSGWEEIDEGRGELLFLLIPRLLGTPR